MSIIGSNILAGASGQGGGYTIENSLRFRSSASASLNRTPTTAGNTRTWTWSGWVKRGGLEGYHVLWASGTTASNNSLLRFDNTYNLRFAINNGTDGNVTTNAIFRDASAWYHIVCALDTTDPTASDRVKIYVNGVRQTLTGTTITLNVQPLWNALVNNAIGVASTGTPALWFDGYLTEINFIDGQALDPASFGDYNEDTGVWQPAAYAGTYGTNGFYLPFSDATTTTTLAADSSGNGNDWTPNNISLTAGATYDSMTDTPTIYAGGGNYATLNPLIPPKTSGTTTRSITNGNLYGAATGGSGWSAVGATITATSGSGKWYWEVNYITANDMVVSIHRPFTTTATFPDAIIGYTDGADVNGYSYQANGNKLNNGSTAYGASYTAGDVIGVALDMSVAGSASITFYKNNLSQGVAFSGLAGDFFPCFSATHAAVASINFGQRPFAYTPPTGFLPLHTGNLPDSTIVDGSQYFDTELFTGTSPTSQSITNLEFQPDFVWFKNRTGGNNHALYDSVRGRALSLLSNATNSEITSSAGNDLVSFDTNGFTVGTVQNHTSTNGSGASIVAWNWKAGTAFSNDAGNNGATIASVGSVNQDAGFSIITHEAQAGTYSFYHGLGVAPSMFVFKNMDAASNWVWWQNDLATPPTTKFLYLNLTNGEGASGSNWLQSVTPNVIELTAGQVHGTSGTYLTYAFAEVEGYSKFGSYVGNGDPNGPFVYLGFRPKFVLVKRADSVSSWWMLDSSRDTFNLATKLQRANEPLSEETSYASMDILSNGFKLRVSSSESNADGGKYIYMAFAENPFKNSLAR